MENSDIEYTPTKAIIPRENPQKRESIDWQLHEVLDSTMPKKLFEIPKDTQSKQIIFGTYGIDGKINSRFLFGFLEIKRLITDKDHQKPQVMVGLTFFTDTPDKNQELIQKFRDEFVDVYDIMDKRSISFTEKFGINGDCHTVSKEVDLSFSNPNLYENITQGKPPIFQRFNLYRFYDLDTSRASNTLNPQDVFVIGLKEALPK